MDTNTPTPKTLTEMRGIIGDFLQNSPDAGLLWDLITCLRGPDSPSEKPNMTSNESREAYGGRRKRKAKTVEVIRHYAFNGIIGGCARSRSDRDYVELPPTSEWDHFDRHVERAAQVLGLEVRVEKNEASKGLEINMVEEEEALTLHQEDQLKKVKSQFNKLMSHGYGQMQSFKSAKMFASHMVPPFVVTIDMLLDTPLDTPPPPVVTSHIKGKGFVFVPSHEQAELLDKIKYLGVYGSGQK